MNQTRHNMKLLAGFLGLCLAYTSVIALDLTDAIQQRITNVLETPETLLTPRDATQHALRLRQFRQFVSEFGRNYESDSELKFRFESFKVNMDEKDYLQANEQGTAEYGLTEFMDYTEKELSRYGRTCKREPSLTTEDNVLFQQMVEVGNQIIYNPSEKSNLPTSVDYRQKGFVSKVLNQGYCSSSWAYAATTVLETTNALKTGKFERLSKQQLIDCDTYNSDCCGGYPHYTYFYLNKTGGIELDKTYNGRAFVQRCHFKPSNVKVQVKGVKLFTNTSVSVNEQWLEHHVAEHGPVAVMLSLGALKSYQKGILRQADTKCSKNSDLLASSVALIGYGEEGGIKYWIGKNSWGVKWGEKGYFRIERGTNMCALATYGVAPIVD